MRLLGIDPGEDIGFSLLDDVKGVDQSWQYNIKVMGQPHRVVYSMILNLYPDVIICEDFYHLPRYMKLSMITAEIIGVVKFYAQTFDIELHMQNRGMKQGWPNAKLKMLDLFVPGEDHEDAMDALRHRLTYQEKHDMIDWTKLKQ